MEEEQKESGNFVTVVSVGTEQHEENEKCPTSDNEFVTVLRIGEKPDENEDITEEVLVYRLPGERLGFGLKFEGGTKATECVKRLFVQSCAPDSPASRVLSSWGHLIEGDEVLVIDSRPVKTMTRMDCVKCLKDSNCIIKLLVRHFKKSGDSEEVKNKVVEDLPQVISAEKKKIPPSPPPVPPRKIPRKLLKPVNNNKNYNESNNIDEQTENKPLPPVRQKHADANNNGKSNCKMRVTSPEFKRCGKFYDGVTVPPDAETYTDLFCQESLNSLSESDDTASTISTVIDRTSNSLPSTPKSIQKHLDISNFPDDEELFNLNSGGTFSSEKLANDTTLKSEIDQEDSDTAKTVEVIAEYKSADLIEMPNSKTSLETQMDFRHDENMNIFSLPRLVDFVPKSINDLDQIKMFLDSERSDHFYDFDIEERYKRTSYDNDTVAYPKWTVSSQLATIGEVEEDGNNMESLTDGSASPTQLPTPIVIVQNADEVAEKTPEITNNMDGKDVKRAEQTMESLPSDPRQPPDGHEFPDFEERLHKTTNDSLVEKFRLSFSQTQHGMKTNSYRKSSFDNYSKDSFGLNKLNSMSNTDLNDTCRGNGHDFIKGECNTIETDDTIPLLYTRSQSLYDIADKKQNDHWQNIMEQRRKSLSKLKGLVIPDAISEVDYSTTINLPEIKSCTSVSIDTFHSLDSSEASNETSQPSSVDSSKFPLISPPWAENVNFPKYSPAFKRKDLKLYSTLSKLEIEKSDLKTIESLDTNKPLGHTESSSGDDSTPPMKSIDSSPTRSESSFECPTARKRSNQKPKPSSLETSFLGSYQRTKNIDEESDNDSAVSSSQSSFVSRPTTSPSPTRSIDLDSSIPKIVHTEFRLAEEPNRHLKSASVEAINRKNILASSKCRSGKDLKVGSPIINRKLEEPDQTNPDSDTKLCEESTLDLKNKEVYTNSVKEDLRDPKCEVGKPGNNPKEMVKSLQPSYRKLSVDVTPRLPLPTTSILKTKFETLTVVPKSQRPNFTRSISKDSAPIFRDILKPIPPVITKKEERISRFSNTKSLSVTDLRKSFEEIARATPPSNSPNEKAAILKNRKSDSVIPQISGYRKSNSIKESPEQITSSPNENTLSRKELSVKTCDVVLKPETVGGNLGITLAGGIDENKEITIHRIRYGSVAYQEGSLTKGDHIISINGVDTKGLTHLEAAELLKGPTKSVVIKTAVREESKSDSNTRKKSLPADTSSNLTSSVVSSNTFSTKKPNHEIIIQKDGNGLGFSVEGGRDSPQGDVPLIVKKIFQGGVAEKDGRLKVGDEILAINDINFTSLSRIQAWTMMKKLDVGTAKILIYR